MKGYYKVRDSMEDKMFNALLDSTETECSIEETDQEEELAAPDQFWNNPLVQVRKNRIGKEGA